MNPSNVIQVPEKKRIGLTTYILIALVLGVFFGHFFPSQAVALKPVGDIFLRMIKMIVVPLVFSSLIMGIAGTGDFKKMGKLGLKALVWFEVATTMALIVALVIANWVKPGAGVDMNLMDPTTFKGIAGDGKLNVVEYLVHMVPTNIVDGMAKANMLQIVVFSTFFGVAAAAAGKAGEPVVNVAKSVAEIMFKFTMYVMKCAPIGVFAFMSYSVGKFGLAMLIPLGKLVGSIYFALIIFVLITLVPACFIYKIKFFQLMRAIKEPLLIGFSTTSSEAALPILMRKLEEFGCPRYIINFVLPTGYSFNLDGATLNMAFAILFMAQLYNMSLDWTQQLAIILVLMLSSKGAAAVPGGSIAIIAGTAASFGIPTEGIALLLSIDRITDMARTTTNIIGNSVATVLVSRWEGELPDEVLEEAYQKSYEEA